MDIQNIKLKPFQDKFIFSDKKTVGIISGVGSGKSFALLLKAFFYGMRWPGSTILIIRKQYSDLIRSTMADWCRFFETKVPADGCFRFPNGSQAFFLHGGEAGDFSVIKSINCAGIFVDQAEELSLEAIDHFRTRLRQNNGAPVRPLCLCANANGHDYLWRMMVQGAKQVNVIDEKSGQTEYLSDDMALYTANSFVNEDVLPPDFIKNLKQQETTSPAFFRRMVMNDFSEEIADDLVFPMLELEKSKKIDFQPRDGYHLRILGCDPARLGNDNTGLIIIQQTGALNWEVIRAEEWQGKEATYTVGRCLETAARMDCDFIVVDSDGLGGPVEDFVRVSAKSEVVGFRNRPYSVEENAFYGNARTKAAFQVKDMILKGHLKITDEKLITELNDAFRVRYITHGQRILVSKDKLRSEGVPSPGLGDALCYAVSQISDATAIHDRRYQTSGGRRPAYSPEVDIYKLYGIR